MHKWQKVKAMDAQGFGIKKRSRPRYYIGTYRK